MSGVWPATTRHRPEVAEIFNLVLAHIYSDVWYFIEQTLDGYTRDIETFVCRTKSKTRRSI